MSLQCKQRNVARASAALPKSESQLAAAAYLNRINPKRYRLNVFTFLEGMCLHWQLIDTETGEELMPETAVMVLGKPAPLEERPP